MYKIRSIDSAELVVIQNNGLPLQLLIYNELEQSELPLFQFALKYFVMLLNFCSNERYFYT